MQKTIRRLIGSRAFYSMVLAILIPIIIQDSISNFVNLLDNLMVGRIGTDQMSGVSVANQLTFVYNLGIFGACAGAGIFTAQFFGAGDTEGVRMAFRYKIYVTTLISVAAVALFYAFGDRLISLYLNEEGDPERVARTLQYGMAYLRIVSIGLIPFGLTQCYASTLRETGETRMPMVASITAVFVNLIFNYLLIFGKLGFPTLGVAGAAYATVLSRFVELAIIAAYTHTHKGKHPFANGLYASMRIPSALVRRITIREIPLLVNELLWAVGMTTLTQIYSLRGLDVIAALNISTTVTNLFSVAYLSMGNAVGIIVGQALGANEIERAKDYVVKLIAFSVAISIVMALILIGFSGVFPMLYNTTASVRTLAARIIRINCLMWPIYAVTHCSYFTLRSGGKTLITFLFDSGCVWVMTVPIAYVMAHFTNLDTVGIYWCVQFTDLCKMLVGVYMLRKGVWIHNIVSDTAK